MKNVKNILVRQEEVDKLNAIINKINNCERSLKTPLKSDKERDLIDLVTGRFPCSKYLSTLKNKPKSNGEILLSQNDWQVFIERLMSESEPSQPLEDYLVDTSIHLQWQSLTQQDALLDIVELVIHLLTLYIEIIKIMKKSS